MVDYIKVTFAESYSLRPRADGKYRFSIELDLTIDSPSRLLEILTSPEFKELSEPEFEFEYDGRNGHGTIEGWRLPTSEELLEIDKKRSRNIDWQKNRDRQEFDRIKKTYPEWIYDNGTRRK